MENAILKVSSSSLVKVRATIIKKTTELSAFEKLPNIFQKYIFLVDAGLSIILLIIIHYFLFLLQRVQIQSQQEHD